MSDEQYPFVDVFAGPGGLGEGLSSVVDKQGNARFGGVASFEHEKYSFQTLHLRNFLRCFEGNRHPDEYYKYLHGSISLEELYSKYPVQHLQASNRVFDITIEPKNRDLVRNLITSSLSGRKKWVLVGGPPCQAYSLIGRSRMKHFEGFDTDNRHFLYREYLRLLVDHAPPVFVMENVKGVLSSRVHDQRIVLQILEDLKRPSRSLNSANSQLTYRLHPLAPSEFFREYPNPREFVVKSENYGIPQKRHRFFILGLRSDIDLDTNTLTPEPPPTLEQTIGNLPKLRSGLSRGNDTFAKWRDEIARLNGEPFANIRLGDSHLIDILNQSLIGECSESEKFERRATNYPGKFENEHGCLDFIHDPNMEILDGHESRSHKGSDLRRYAFTASFASVFGRTPTLPDFPKPLLPNHKNVEKGRAGVMFSDRFRVQIRNQPATTVTSHIAKDGHYYIHYDVAQCRSLTVREAARLQTFPDNYKFEGPRTAQYHQIGNAVPPYLAKQIGQIVVDVLDRIE